MQEVKERQGEKEKVKKINYMNICYKCEYRGTIPGDRHSQCLHPNAKRLDVVGDSNGIRRGWFFHPFNFDPVWLKYCEGFKEL